MIASSFAVWLAATFGLFAALPARRAMVTALVGGWLFLPMTAIQIRGLPDLEKLSLLGAGIAAAAFVFDAKRWLALRPRWFDLPMLVWCTTPMASSLANDLGWYDGASTTLNEVLLWGLPYVLGRLYCADLEGLRELAVAVVVGALAYIPFCVFEMVAGPILGHVVYGLRLEDVLTTWRFGGWRPTVFLGTGLTVALFFVAASLLLTWGWWSRRQAPFGAAARPLAAALVVTTLLLKSVNGWVLLGLGLLAHASIRRGLGPLVIAFLIGAAPTYVVARVAGFWDGSGFKALATSTLGPDRGESIRFRIFNERLLMRKAERRPLFGWGGWGRLHLHPHDKAWIGITDSLWIRVLGKRGLVGLISCFAVLALAPLRFWSRYPIHRWLAPELGAAAGFAILLCLWAIDCCLNDMLNPIYLAAAGGLIALPAAVDVVERTNAASSF